MRSQVSYQSRRLCKALRADFAEESLRGVGFFRLLAAPVVLQLVDVHLLLLDETFRAARTLVRLNHIVLGNVNFEMLAPVELFRTDVTQIFFTFVHLN